MADTSQAVVGFESEEARQTALDAIEERPENEAKIDEILSAPIRKKGDAAVEKPAETPTPPPEAASKAEEPKQATVDETVFTIKRDELPEGFDTPGKVFKSYREAQDLITRQTKFIKEKLGGEGSSTQELQAALQRAATLETELAETKKKYERPAQTETRKQDLTAIPESKGSQIKELRVKLQDLVKDPIANEEEIHRLNIQLNGFLFDEIERNQLLTERAENRAAAAENKAVEAEGKATSWVQKSEQSEQSKRAQEALQKEYQDIDSFTNDKNYAEFRMTRPAAQVEQDYVKWAQEVTNLYYGAPVDVRSPDGNKAMKHALSMLERGAPDITEKCRVAGVPQQPSEDVKKYLEICELLDYRDGYRMSPTTGQRELVQRWHGPTQKYVPDAFPSLSAAYEDRKIRDGFYAKRIREAFVNGGQQMADAITKRDAGAVEMDNAVGASKRDAGLTMSKSEAAKVIDEIDETLAEQRRRAGDPTLYNKLMEAFKVLGMSID